MISFFKFIEIGVQKCFNHKRYVNSNIQCCWSFYKKRKKIRMKIYEPKFLITDDKSVIVSKTGWEYTSNLLRLITFKTYNIQIRGNIV